MDRGQDFVRSIFVLAAYLMPAALLVWRAETYVDANGEGLLLARSMCILLALMIFLIGLMRSLEAFESDASSE